MKVTKIKSRPCYYKSFQVRKVVGDNTNNDGDYSTHLSLPQVFNLW